jgi:hypothetical protein
MEAVREHEIHVSDFWEFNAVLPKEDTTEWLRVVVEWECDRTKPNPFKTTQLSKSHELVYTCNSD